MVQGADLHNPCANVYLNEARHITLEKSAVADADGEAAWSLQVAGMAIGTGKWYKGGIDFSANSDAFGSGEFRLEWTRLPAPKATPELRGSAKKFKATPKTPAPKKMPTGVPEPANAPAVKDKSATEWLDEDIQNKVPSNIKAERSSLLCSCDLIVRYK